MGGVKKKKQKQTKKKKTQTKQNWKKIRKAKLDPQ